MFLRNYWYVAAFSSELGQEPLGRTILNEPVALFRTCSGKVAALEDRCAHRLMPLSKGWVDNEMLVCCYHGLGYDGSGACVRVPGRDKPSGGIAVRCFPTVERYGAVWIWMGDPKLADSARILDCKLMDPAGGNGTRVYLHVNANYMFINDNLCDLLHVAFLHNAARKNSSSIGNTLMENGKLEVGQKGDRIFADWVWSGVPTPPTWRRLGNIGERADGWILSTFIAPSFLINPIGFAEAGTGGSDSPLPQGRGKFSFTLYQCITPETERSTHFFKLMAHENWTPEMAQQGIDLIKTVNAEDIWAMELQQQALDRDPDATMHAIPSDGGVIRMRRLMERLFKEEAARAS
jgi:phenylpropionate dioxygenase-like ring-hydroxylating dioxygenase large terminal subunit